MSADRTVDVGEYRHSKIRCDGSAPTGRRCNARILGGFGKGIKDARFVAQTRGWTVHVQTAGRLRDYCPRHTPPIPAEVDPQVPDPLIPGTPEWAGVITASKVAAILGLSPYDSPLSCWHKMKGNVPLEQETEDHRRGHYAEPAILAWWQDQHPEFTDIVRHPQYRMGHLAATPDAHASGIGVGEALVEAKTARSLDEWGTPGTDEIPAYYLTQVLFQLHVAELDRAYVPVWGSWFEWAEYVVDYDADLVAGIITKCEAFWESLQANEPPPLDDTVATFKTLKALHPDIEVGEVVELEPELALEFVGAKNALDKATALTRGTTSRVLDVMGRAQFAYCRGVKVARRQPGNGGVAIHKVAKTTDGFIEEEV